ncbi:ComEC/Rec2 family competence protein [Sphingobacterium composti Ten et al. 2007 non Yoo et al. 2007]|uniref:ComEC/Rec2 family competence protein n=1 Tax=Sphingobacterium composti TaxID=363260 RepID=UPI0021CFC3AE|nr:ComEC/Rec2 family competence protein [Sphingobacterium composti Ten et al. 2007 non Yoo et al. 2007]
MHAVCSQSYISPTISTIFICLCMFIYIGLSITKRLPQKHLFTICFSLLVISYGYYSYSKTQNQHIPNYYQQHDATQSVGIIDDEPVYKEKTIRFPVKLTNAIDSNRTKMVSGKVMLTILRDSLKVVEYRYGDKIVLVNKLMDVNPPYNPKEFDYKSYLANKGIAQQALLKQDEILVLERNHGNALIAYSLDLRTNLIAKFRKYIHDDEAFNVAVALIFGYRSQIDQQTISAFTNTGTIHVLSVSGLHVSLVFVLLNFVLFWMDRFRYGKLIKSVIILLFIWAYVILTGMSPPILRAGIMISFFVSSVIINRKQVPVNTLGASALFILLFAPNYLFDVGFQLSYLAILGIILLYPILKNYYLTPNKWVNYVLEYVYVSISTQLFTLPLTLYYFRQFPNYFLLANLFIALPSTLIMYLGVGLVLVPFEWTNLLFGFLVGWTLNFMMQGLEWIGHLPSAVISGVDWHWSQVVILLIGIAALIIALNSKLAKAFIFLLVSILVLTVFNGFTFLQKSNYSALVFYNIRSEIAVAQVTNNNVLLFSTLDSINHQTLQYSVLPDLRQFSTEGAIQFQHISNEERQNKILEMGPHKILFLEMKMDNLPSEVNFVLWRKNNYTDIQKLKDNYPNATILLDGSNSDKTIERLKSAFESNSERLYILKNNFAYVWKEE